MSSFLFNNLNVFSRRTQALVTSLSVLSTLKSLVLQFTPHILHWVYVRSEETSEACRSSTGGTRRWPTVQHVSKGERSGDAWSPGVQGDEWRAREMEWDRKLKAFCRFLLVTSSVWSWDLWVLLLDTHTPPHRANTHSHQLTVPTHTCTHTLFSHAPHYVFLSLKSFFLFYFRYFNLTLNAHQH